MSGTFRITFTTIENVKCVIYIHIYLVFSPESKCMWPFTWIVNDVLTLDIYCISH